jgi:DNA-binding transcriptional LysR family regulator
MIVNSDWLETFATFAAHRNFTRAAEELHISQPAVHAQIRKLTELVGVPLYTRSGRRLELTRAGETLWAFARESRERSGAILDELRTGDSAQPVCLAAGEGAFLYLLGPAIRAFVTRRLAPLSVLTRDRDQTLAAVRTGQAHLGVTVLDAAPADLRAEPLASVGQTVIVPRGHALARKRRVRLVDLAGQTLVLPPPDRPHRMVVARALSAAGVTVEVGVEASGWELMAHFVSLGLGVAVVNACCRLPRGVVSRPLPELPPVRYQVIRRGNARLSSPARALLELLHRNVG